MKPLEHGYTNDTRTDGSVVVKRYYGPEWAARLTTERAVLCSCGKTLVRIQSIDVRTMFPDAPDGAVLVHGDFGSNNMIFDPATFDTTAVLAWEWAQPGDPLGLLAWCEWIIRMHHPGEVGALDALFAAYGRRPVWAERQCAALAKCRRMLAMPRPEGDAAPGARRLRIVFVRVG